jgi:serine/threonine protein kinase
MEKMREALPPGTVIDCYTIIKLIGSGGFSLIYLAEDEDTQDQVVIKEYLPKKLATRNSGDLRVCVASEDQINALNNGRKLFYQEAKTLASLKHPNIVNVRNFFLCFDTAYMVMDYEHGKNLGHYIKRRKGNLSTTFLKTVFPPILDALSLIHSKGQLHLDIKPYNIHLRPGGDPLLLDFGAAHRIATSRRRQSSQVVTAGFSPVEQYYAAGYVGPWSDVYAIGATMRACIDGKSPQSAVERHAKDNMRPAAIAFKRRYPAYLLEIIDWAMEVDPLLRPQNAGDMLQAMISETGYQRPADGESSLEQLLRSKDSHS